MKISTKPDDKALWRRLIHQINDRLEHLQPGKNYQLEDILGADYWDDEDDSHLALGHAFSALVQDRRVPFIFKGFSKDRHNEYHYDG